LLVNPETPVTFWGLKHALKFMSRKALLPPLGLLTVAAMLPERWEKKLVDLGVTTLDDRDIRWADYVFVGGMSVQRASARSVIDRCKELRAKVVMGGPLVTVYHEEFDDVDHLVLGEAEVTLPFFLRDLAEGQPQHIYQSDRWADMHETPAPLWDLADVNQYGMLPVQYSRGCPFDCDFCDVTVLFGHRMRTKTAESVLRELDRLYALGWRREVFFVDDNFIGNRQNLKQEVLPAITDWMDRHRYPFSFYTQTSLNLADDDELMHLLAQAGYECVFIGIETVGDEGFVECNKVQNRHRDLVASVHKIQRFGMQVQGGFILGFDSDPPSVFDDMIDFIQRSGIVTAMVGLLLAPRGTQLYERMARENRLLHNPSGDNTDGYTNFVPKMGLAELRGGYRKVVGTLYRQDRFYERIWQFLQTYEPVHKTRLGYGWKDARRFFSCVYCLGIKDGGRRQFWRLLFWALRHPRDLHLVLLLAVMGYHFRQVFADLEMRDRLADSCVPHAESIGA
jgi:radical SAM superfamily enzyme YgiQ (UPF0313 family)